MQLFDIVFRTPALLFTIVYDLAVTSCRPLGLYSISLSGDLGRLNHQLTATRNCLVIPSYSDVAGEECEE